MTEIEVKFLGFLANVDSSILKLKLNHNFKVEEVSKEEGYKILIAFEKFSRTQLFLRILHQYNILNRSENKFYFISNSLKIDHEQLSIPDTFQLLIFNYLVRAFQKMRLFKEGNICMPIKYYYAKGVPDVPILRTYSPSNIIHGSVFSVEDTELAALQQFIEKIQLPFQEPYLQLAFEAYDLSYQISDLNLAFLSLMIGLEALFSGESGELTYRISRNTAVLLGKEEKDAEKTFSDVKKLYQKRSDLVHGRGFKADYEIVLKTRKYLRDSVKEISKLGIDRKELFRLLNSSGFGEKSWKT